MSTAEINVAILCGGRSAEAEVSHMSANAIAAALATQPRFRSQLIELDSALIDNLRAFDPAVVLPALHGPPGEDGTVQGLLEMLGLPYVGSGVQASAFAMDKSVAKALFQRAGLPLAADLVCHKRQGAASIAALVKAQLGTAVVIKPMQQGSAIGVTPLPNGGDIEAAVAAALHLGDQVLIERFIVGRELTVGVLDLHGALPRALPVTEITTADGEWYDYHNRYTKGGSAHIIPAAVSGELAAHLQQIAIEAHSVLGLRDLSRADFILSQDNEPVLLEVNTLPGMTPVSLYPDGAAAAGYPFPELLAELLDSALRRHRGS